MLAKKSGRDKVVEVILKIYTSSEISELNFSEKDLKEVVLPLTQLDLIKVEKKYFRFRPDENKTRYYIFSISRKGESVIHSILEELNLPKVIDFLMHKYPSKFLAFIAHFFIPDGSYHEEIEKEYQKLLKKGRFTNLIEDFKKDVEKLKCAFWVKEHTSKRVDSYHTLMILPDFISTLKKTLPKEIVKSEMDEFELVELIEYYFLEPQAHEDWHEEFLDRLETGNLQKLWIDWKEKLTLENIILNNVVIDAGKLRAFLAKKIEKVQRNIAYCSKSEQKIKDFLKSLESTNIVISKSDVSDIMTSCKSRKDFSIFISAIYRILHDQMRIKDKIIDSIRCYFHHGKQDKRQELNKSRFKKFCKECLIHFEPKGDEWEILKVKVLERAINNVKEYQSMNDSARQQEKTCYGKTQI